MVNFPVDCVPLVDGMLIHFFAPWIVDLKRPHLAVLERLEDFGVAHVGLHLEDFEF
jgi:hypothetical protein